MCILVLNPFSSSEKCTLITGLLAARHVGVFSASRFSFEPKPALRLRPELCDKATRLIVSIQHTYSRWSRGYIRNYVISEKGTTRPVNLPLLGDAP